MNRFTYTLAYVLLTLMVSTTSDSFAHVQCRVDLPLGGWTEGCPHIHRDEIEQIPHNIEREAERLADAVRRAEREARAAAERARTTFDNFNEHVNEELTRHCGFTGYRSTLGSNRRDVARGGWTVAWSDPVTERDAINGVIAGGVSVSTSNPGPFVIWAKALAERTLRSLVGRVEQEFAAELESFLSDEAVRVVLSALSGRVPRVVEEQFNRIGVKVGAITYNGGNYVCGENIGPTFGFQIYVAIRLPNSIISTDSEGQLTNTRRFVVENSCRFPIRIALRYLTLSGSWRTVYWWNFDPNDRATLASDDTRLVTRHSVSYYYAYIEDRNYSWRGSEDNQMDRSFVFNNREYRFRRHEDSDGDTIGIFLDCNNLD